MGPRTPDELARIYRAADALILPSRGEGFPLSVQEAIASGLPAFVCADPAYERYVSTLGHRLVPVGSPGQPADAAYFHRALKDYFAAPPREPSGTPPQSWDGIAAQHEALYDRVRELRVTSSAR
jgi:glycosyltransferase involved in cell wall biosynthesis